MTVIERLRGAARNLLIGILLCAGTLLPAAAEPPIPALSGRVVDQAGILDAGTIDAITRQLAGYESSTGNQVVVVTLPDLKGYPIEDWGLALGRGWGIGQKGRNNGVLLVVAPKDRQLRIEVGYGLEGNLPDATANTIIDSEIIPYFKRGDMPGGIRAGVNAILAALGGSYKPTTPTAKSSGSAFDLVPFFVFPLIFFAVVLMNIGRGGRRTRRYAGGTWGGGFGRGGFSSGGGGFSGGGGSFGGGGASGRW